MGPVTSALAALHSISLSLNLVFLLIVFVGGLYVAIHARNIPLWVRTPLWYLGVISFLTALTIVLEFVLGPDFVLSYSNVGVVAEMLINLNLAIAALLMLMHTVFKDLRCMKKRRRRRSDDV